MIDLRTPSGYTAQLKDFLDTKGYRAIKRAMLKQIQMHPGMDQEDVDISGDVMMDSEDVALQERW